MQIVVAASDASWTELGQTTGQALNGFACQMMLHLPLIRAQTVFSWEKTISGYANLSKPVVIDSVVNPAEPIPPNVLH